MNGTSDTLDFNGALWEEREKKSFEVKRKTWLLTKGQVECQSQSKRIQNDFYVPSSPSSSLRCVCC